MTDLNDWRLSYPGITDLDFGPSSTPYPFETQVVIGDPEMTTRDTLQGSVDGMVMGRDTLGGFPLTFTLTMLPTYPRPAKPWVNALDTFAAFKRSWRADAIRLNPYQYATLQNLDRLRQVYGRPRGIAQMDTARLRKGQVGYVAQFESVDPNFYSTTEGNIVLANAVNVNGNNLGDTPTWPVISLTGPFTAGTVELRLANIKQWGITVPGPIAAGVTLNIDTRPWSRFALLGVLPGNGLLRGDALDKCKIPTGAFAARWTRTDATNTSSGTFKWRDAYVSL